MRRLIAGLLAVFFAGCSGMTNAGMPENDSLESLEDPAHRPAPTETQISLENLGPAPELENEIWLNADHPLRLADLRGQVVLLDMWTFG